MTIIVEDSDIGLRRIDHDDVLGTELFSIVVDTGTGCGFLVSKTDWRTLDELRNYALRLNEAADWLEAQ